MKRFFALVGFAIIVFLANTTIQAQSTIASSTQAKTNVPKSETVANVVLQSFDLTKSGNAIKINWQTASEKNNNYFEIQRSIDGVQYEVIALMFAKEDAEKGAAYRYTDQEMAKLNADKVYYRLRIIDITGKSTMIESKKLAITESIVTQ